METETDGQIDEPVEHRRWRQFGLGPLRPLLVIQKLPWKDPAQHLEMLNVGSETANLTRGSSYKSSCSVKFS